MLPFCTYSQDSIEEQHRHQKIYKMSDEKQAMVPGSVTPPLEVMVRKSPKVVMVGRVELLPNLQPSDLPSALAMFGVFQPCQRVMVEDTRECFSDCFRLCLWNSLDSFHSEEQRSPILHHGSVFDRYPYYSDFGNSLEQFHQTGYIWAFVALDLSHTRNWLGYGSIVPFALSFSAVSIGWYGSRVL